jgi:hypothetical protein
VRAASGLPGLVAGRLLIGRCIGLGLLDARLDLRAGFLTGLIRGNLQMGDLILQGLNVLSQPVRLIAAHFLSSCLIPPGPGSAAPPPSWSHRFTVNPPART